MWPICMYVCIYDICRELKVHMNSVNFSESISTSRNLRHLVSTKHWKIVLKFQIETFKWGVRFYLQLLRWSNFTNDGDTPEQKVWRKTDLQVKLVSNEIFSLFVQNPRCKWAMCKTSHFILINGGHHEPPNIIVFIHCHCWISVTGLIWTEDGDTSLNSWIPQWH